MAMFVLLHPMYLIPRIDYSFVVRFFRKVTEQCIWQSIARQLEILKVEHLCCFLKLLTVVKSSFHFEYQCHREELDRSRNIPMRQILSCQGYDVLLNRPKTQV